MKYFTEGEIFREIVKYFMNYLGLGRVIKYFTIILTWNIS